MSWPVDWGGATGGVTVNQSLPSLLIIWASVFGENFLKSTQKRRAYSIQEIFLKSNVFFQKIVFFLILSFSPTWRKEKTCLEI